MGDSSRAGTWKQELNRGHGKVLLTGFPLGLISLFPYNTQDHQPRSSTTLNRLGPLPPITNYKNALQACLQKNLRAVFSQLRARFPDDSSLRQVDMKLLRTISQWLDFVLLNMIKIFMDYQPLTCFLLKNV